jgi:hypothetical protein
MCSILVVCVQRLCSSYSKTVTEERNSWQPNTILRVEEWNIVALVCQQAVPLLASSAPLLGLVKEVVSQSVLILFYSLDTANAFLK